MHVEIQLEGGEVGAIKPSKVGCDVTEHVYDPGKRYGEKFTSVLS